MSQPDPGASQGGDPGKSQGDDNKGSQGDPADVAKLQQTLAEQQKKVDELLADNKKYRDERAAAAEQKKKDDEAAAAAKLSEEEKTVKRLADMEAQLEQAKKAAVTKGTRAALVAAASKAKATNPEDVFRLIDDSKIEYDAEGEVTNATELVEELKKSRPTYFGGGNFDQGPRGNAAANDVTKDELLKDLPRSPLG
jgi:DNA repair exonuclease SbcCD ATPase subunit